MHGSCFIYSAFLKVEQFTSKLESQPLINTEQTCCCSYTLSWALQDLCQVKVQSSNTTYLDNHRRIPCPRYLDRTTLGGSLYLSHLYHRTLSTSHRYWNTTQRSWLTSHVGERLIGQIYYHKTRTSESKNIFSVPNQFERILHGAATYERRQLGR